LSITEIETWLRDPYAIYARHVLKLEPLAPLDEPVGARERGTALHKALERFLLTYPDGLPDDAPLQLAALADTAFAEMGIPKGALAVWRPRFLAAAQALVKIEAARRETIAHSFAERRGTLTITAPGGDFTLSGRADRIDLLKSGGAVVMDYKSGRAPSRKQVEQLLSPQLPLEAAMLATGGFAEIGVHATEALIYLSLFDKEADGEKLDVDVAALAEKAVAQLTARVRAFDQPGVGYAARLMPYRSDSEGDYDHLARVREWSNAGGGE
jgi:ATP-dependent helicase/nuclease subunit B